MHTNLKVRILLFVPRRRTVPFVLLVDRGASLKSRTDGKDSNGQKSAQERMSKPL